MHVRRPLPMLALVAATAFVAGYAVNRIKASLFPWPTQVVFDRVSARTPIACPSAGPRTFVVVIFGQSLGGNWAGERSVGLPGVTNAYKGRCYEAKDPLLGSTGVAGNVWTEVANNLVRKGVVDNVVLVSVSRNDAPIAIWRPNGAGEKAMRQALVDLRPLTPSAFVVEQGQIDRIRNTPADAYRADYLSAIQNARNLGGGAPLFVSQEAGFCGEEGANEPVAPDNPISAAQRSLVDPAHGVYSGPAVDLLAPASLRYDGCHPSGKGVQVLARAWSELIADHLAKQPGATNPHDPALASHHG